MVTKQALHDHEEIPFFMLINSKACLEVYRRGARGQINNRHVGPISGPYTIRQPQAFTEDY